MKLSEKRLNEIYDNKDTRPLSLFLRACEREIVNDEWGRPLSMSHQYLSDQEVLYFVDWWKKKSAKQKYTIKVAPTSLGYFGIDYDEGDATIDSSKNEFYQTYFTKSEIEQLKQRDDLAIDWDKAKIEPVEG